MFAVEVRDHVMIAHSFRGALFGPAQALHGAFRDRRGLHVRLVANGVVIDIGRAHECARSVSRSTRNLGDNGWAPTRRPISRKTFYDRLAEAARAGKLGREGRELAAIRITISESHVARAWYEAPLW